MSLLPVLDELPATYRVERTPRAVAAVHESVDDALVQLGWGACTEPELRRSRLQGRKPLFELETRDEVLLVRRFSHGGLMRWATGERFRDPQRPFREVLLSEHLHVSGILTPRVVAARARAASVGLGWRLEVLTRRVPDSCDLGFLLAQVQRDGGAGPEIGRLLVALGRLVARMHQVGFLHADLNPNNVLVERASLAGEARLWVLDLDRSRILPRLSDEQRWANIGRLFRHVRRREEERGHVLRRTDLRRFLQGYGLDREGWKACWRAIEAAQGGDGWHRIGWIIERRFGAADPRALS